MAKGKARRSTLLRSVFSFLVPNQCEALYGIRNLLRHRIDTECRMESSRTGCMESSRRRGLLRRMPYNAKGVDSIHANA